MRGFSLVAASGGHSSSRCAGLSPSRPLPLRSTGSRRAGSAIVAHGPSCSAARGIFPDQGSNQCPLPRQADSQPPRHQGSPTRFELLNPHNNGVGTIVFSILRRGWVSQRGSVASQGADAWRLGLVLLRAVFCQPQPVGPQQTLHQTSAAPATPSPMRSESQHWGAAGVVLSN